MLIIPCLLRYLDFMFDGNNGPIRPQDFRVIYNTLAQTPQGISALIEFLTTKLDRILNEVINGEQVVKSIYSLLSSTVALNGEIIKVYVVSCITQKICYLTCYFVLFCLIHVIILFLKD